MRLSLFVSQAPPDLPYPRKIVTRPRRRRIRGLALRLRQYQGADKCRECFVHALSSLTNRVPICARLSQAPPMSGGRTNAGDAWACVSSKQRVLIYLSQIVRFHCFMPSCHSRHVYQLSPSAGCLWWLLECADCFAVAFLEPSMTHGRPNDAVTKGRGSPIWAWATFEKRGIIKRVKGTIDALQ